MNLGIVDSPLHSAYQRRKKPGTAHQGTDESSSTQKVRDVIEDEDPLQQIGCIFRIFQWFGMDPIIVRWKLIDSIQRTLPFTRELPANVILTISFLIILVLVAIFLIFFFIGYINGLDTTYLSPYDISNYSQTSTSRYCNQVLTTITGNFLATSTGEWQWSPTFQYSNATYQAVVTSLSISFHEYSYLMNLIYMSISKLGQQAAQNSLTYNLIYWMTAVFVIPGTTTQRFYLTGNPTTVFNRQHTGGTVSSVIGSCPSKNVTSSTFYDSNSGIIQISYQYDQYIANQQCLAGGNPEKLGYIPTISTDEFVLKFDVRSLISAISINVGVISADELVVIAGFQADVPFQGHIFHVATYYNPKFPSMSPMVCISGNDNDQSLFLCGLGWGDTYVVPIFNHFGANQTYPVECDCANRDSLNLESPYANCNKFNFISGVFYWNTSDALPILEVLSRYDYNYTKINAAAFQASFMDSYWGLTSPYSNLVFQSPTFRADAYSFCNSTVYGLCSMAIFSSFDDDFQANWAISEYYYILSNGACRDSITPRYDDWMKLIDYPFAPLVESYQKCSYSRTVLFLNQAGIAMGNASLLAPIGALLVITVYYFLRWCRASDGLSPFVPYSRVEIDRVNYTLGLALLYARDGKIPDNKKDGEITKAVIETLANDETIICNPKIMTIVRQLHAELSSLSEKASLQQQQSHIPSGDSFAVANPVIENSFNA